MHTHAHPATSTHTQPHQCTPTQIHAHPLSEPSASAHCQRHLSAPPISALCLRPLSAPLLRQNAVEILRQPRTAKHSPRVIVAGLVARDGAFAGRIRVGGVAGFLASRADQGGLEGGGGMAVLASEAEFVRPVSFLHKLAKELLQESVLALEFHKRCQSTC